jgi:hypothetical protein
MADLSTDSLVLAGFALAHAAWSVSHTADDELLCPLAVVQDADDRRLMRFEAAAQEPAILNARMAMHAKHCGCRPFPLSMRRKLERAVTEDRKRRDSRSQA